MKGNRRSLCALLVDDLLEQVGGCLGEGELAEARIHGGEVGVEDLVESVVLHVNSFSAALCLPFAAILLFRYALIVGMSSPSPHVIPIDSFVYSSVCQKIFEITYRTITIT